MSVIHLTKTQHPIGYRRYQAWSNWLSGKLPNLMRFGCVNFAFRRRSERSCRFGGRLQIIPVRCNLFRVEPAGRIASRGSLAMEIIASGMIHRD